MFDHMETYHDLRQNQFCRLDDFSPGSYAGCYRDELHIKLVLVGKMSPVSASSRNKWKFLAIMFLTTAFVG